MGDRMIYFGEKSVASEYARHGPYADELIEVLVPKSWIEKFKSVYPDGTGSRFEYRIPYEEIDNLNTFERTKVNP